MSLCFYVMDHNVLSAMFLPNKDGCYSGLREHCNVAGVAQIGTLYAQITISNSWGGTSLKAHLNTVMI